MKQSTNIANRLREVLLNGHWIANTNCKEQLQLVTWRQAIHKVGNLNTISALTFHLNYYLSGVFNAFNTGKLEIKDQYSFDMPPVENETDWQKLTDDFLRNAEMFAAKVEEISDEQLQEAFIDEKYGTNLRNVEGMIEHCYYHLGQISLIRKLIANI
ncbi:DinB family protein [Elizabethkingia bruuniana]|uniref:DinB family protein n=1 Tax=Elizabethkingia bruuniana TaxID=1756149 RepID=UPI00241DDF5C|nr:DinB family protein [Elizabethkingia bruuniana]